MTILVADCDSWIHTTLGGPLPARIPLLTLVNQAGRHLCGMTAWRWLESRSTTLGVTAAQNYCTLPDDYGSAISVDVDGRPGSTYWVTRGDMDILRAATNPSSDTSLYAVCVAYVSATTTDAPTPVLELSPTPQTTDADYFIFTYRAQWADLDEDDERVPVPSFCETLFITVLQAFARGFLREEQGSLGARLAEIRAGEVFKQALRDDRTKQASWGVIRGAIQEDRGYDSILTTTTGP